MPMSRLRRAVLILVPLLILAGAVVYLSLDRILKTTVESQTSDSLHLSTTLKSARLSLLGGKVNLNQLHIASPRGFSAPHMLELGGIDLSVKYGQLRKDPIHVESLVLNQPRLVIEQSNGAINFKKAMDLTPPARESSSRQRRRVAERRGDQGRSDASHCRVGRQRRGVRCASRPTQSHPARQRGGSGREARGRSPEADRRRHPRRAGQQAVQGGSAGAGQGPRQSLPARCRRNTRRQHHPDADCGWSSRAQETIDSGYGR